MPSLTKLSLSFNELENFPDISGCQALCEIRLSHNKIKNLPNEEVMSKFTKRVVLIDLSHNLLDKKF